MGTKFTATGYQRNYQPDKELIDTLVDESLARHFNWRLEYLLANERKQSWPFVVANLPQVYRLRLSEHWEEYLGEDGRWETTLRQAGFGDHLRSERNLLLIPSRVGRIRPEILEQVRAAGAVDDFARVNQLLQGPAEEVRGYLEFCASQHLAYRPPAEPHLNNRAEKDLFEQAIRLEDHAEYEKAASIVQGLWEQDIANNNLRAWTAYLHLKNSNLHAAEPMLEHLHKTSGARKDSGYIIDWNLAALCVHRHDEAGAFALLLPWVDHSLDAKLVEVLLHLALCTEAKAKFLSLIPHTKHLRFHALAFRIATHLGDERSQRRLLGQMLYQGSGAWELPSIHVRYTNPEELKSVVSKAIVENQTDQVINWLKERIRLTPFYIPNYIELARVYEMEKLDIDSAYFYLNERLKQEAQKKPRNPARLEEACTDLLGFCKRQRRVDLGQRAYRRVAAEHASEALLAEYQTYQQD